MTNNKYTEKEILESLYKSGYLLESEITKSLVEFGFFVESNVSSLDPLTSKSRELDLIAEFDHEDNEERYRNEIIAKVRFVFEIKNNNAPLVLLTKYVWSPNSHIWNGLKVAVTMPKHLENYFFHGFYDVLFNNQPKEMFTQYCSFSKKNNKEGELMAHHPENIYSSLLKITHYCEESIEDWNDPDKEYNGSYFRKFLYLPIILINEDLFELETEDNNDYKLKKVNCSRLVFNYHYKQKPKTAIIHIVTKTGLKDFLIEVLKAEKEVEKNMLKAKEEFNEKSMGKKK